MLIALTATTEGLVVLVLVVIIVVVAVLLIVLLVLLAVTLVERAAAPVLLEAAIRGLTTEAAAILVAATPAHIVVASAAAPAIRPASHHRPSAPASHHVSAAALVVVVPAARSRLRAAASTKLARGRSLVESALLLHRGWGWGLKLGLRRRWTAILLIWPIKTLAFGRRELLRGAMLRIVLTVLAMLLLLLGEIRLLRLLKGLWGDGLLVWDWRDSLRCGLGHRRGCVGLLEGSCLGLVGAVLRLLLRWGWGRLGDRGRWLVVLLLLCSLLLLLPVRAIPIVCIELGLISRTSSDGGGGGGSSGLLCL